MDPPPRRREARPHSENPSDAGGGGDDQDAGRCVRPDDNGVHSRQVLRASGSAGSAAREHICQTSRRAGAPQSEATVAGQGRRLPPPPRGLALTRGVYAAERYCYRGLWPHVVTDPCLPSPSSSGRGRRHAGGEAATQAQAPERRARTAGRGAGLPAGVSRSAVRAPRHTDKAADRPTSRSREPLPRLRGRDAPRQERGRVPGRVTQRAAARNPVLV